MHVDYMDNARDVLHVVRCLKGEKWAPEHSSLAGTKGCAVSHAAKPVHYLWKIDQHLLIASQDNRARILVSCLSINISKQMT